MAEKNFDVADILGDLDAGVFQRKLSRAMADTALAVTTQDGKSRKGKVTVTFDFSRLSENGNQVNVTHSLDYSLPTRRGKKSEKDATETPMYVGANGTLTMLPFKQESLFDGSKKA